MDRVSVSGQTDAPLQLGPDERGVAAQLQNAKVLLQFLKAISISEDVCFVLSQNGMKLTAEDSKSMQANAFIQRDLFRTFQLQCEDDEAGSLDADSDEDDGEDAGSQIAFRLNVSSLIDCLSMFGMSGAQPVLCLKYVIGEPLRIWLEESGVVIEIIAKTLDTIEILDFNFMKATLGAKVILNSDKLKDTFSDLDMSSEFLELCLCPQSSELHFVTSGSVGELDVLIPSESEIVSQFDVQKFIHTKYRMSMIRQALKPIPMSEKMSVRVDSREILCLQYMVKVEDAKSFIEFICLPHDHE